MDFQSLSRRELQALCKKNKIPANMTNVAMADSLKSLETVKGIDEVLQACESGIAQLSIEPGVRLEEASPFLPPTGGRSTRRKNAAKEETSRHLTQTTMAEYADESQVDAFETPVAPQTNRKKKGQIASACRKMDSLLKECAQEEKKDALLTPAPSGFTSRRRSTAEDSAVKQVQGTRRSARLAEKSAKLMKETGNENPVFSKKDLFTDGQELKLKLKESLDGLDEISGVTDVSASINLEVNSAKKDEAHVDSAKKQEIATGVEPAPTFSVAKQDLNESWGVEIKKREVGSHNLDFTVVDAVTIVEEKPNKKLQSEVPCDTQVAPTVEEVELVSPSEGELSDSETDEAQETDGSDVTETSKTKMTQIGVEKVEESTYEDPGPEDEAADECEDDFAFSENEDSDPKEVTPSGVNEEVLEHNTDINGNSSETESNPDESDSINSEESTKSNDSLAVMPSDHGLISEEDDAINGDVILQVDEKILVKDKQLELEQSAKLVSPGTMLEDAGADEIVQPEDNVKTVDQVVLGAANYPSDAPSSEEPVDASLRIPPVRASAIKKRTLVAASDNKENIDSGSKTTRTKERSKVVKEVAPKLDDHAMNQLVNEIKKLDMKEGGNEVTATARPALQPLPENQGLEPEPAFSEEDARGALEISASTGKFWLDWEKLRSILSYYLKQVWGEYSEAKMTTEQQTSLLGETFQELVKRLDDVIHSFDEGPPFTLQRLCEILLSARSIYPKLSKLSLALEKNLLVTSTLKISSDPYPLTTEQNSNGPYEGNGNALPQNNAVENGVEASPVEDRDEVMAEAQEAEVGEDTTMEMETIDDIVKSTEANSTPKV
ncbi:serine/threonine-protein phosphatase 4 regulatory subunit-like protein [Perilla frutescens var. frutescens]|nr:serine/threonine-protein phosphatase 4 regulatory subunit-like protein [Perilla frutescens var. frutescens]